MVHLRPVFERSKACKSLLPAGVELLEQAVQTSETLGFGCVLEGLVLRQDVDEAVADVVAVLQEELLASVAEATGVEDDVVVRGQGAVVAVHLPDVRRPVLIGLLEAAARLVFGLVFALHDRLDADRRLRAQEGMEGAGVVAEDVGAATADD